ncbi:MAG: hypothetical protein Q8Q23_03850 [bacterium]|nr:hypothetical protein [bacterium]
MYFKKNILPNIIFIFIVIVVPVFFMFISSLGAESEVIKIVLR